MTDMTDVNTRQAQTAPAGELHHAQQVEQTACCIAGAGPAGAILSLLLARQGVPVILLEAQTDFEREFRGDTIHPAVMENLAEIGLADKLLQLRHTEVSRIAIQTRDGPIWVNLGAGFAFWKTRFPYITVIAQSRFLEFITGEAGRYPNFRLVLGAHVEELIEENGVVRGLRYRSHDGRHEVRARLTVAADGRFSRLRKLAGLLPAKNAPMIDILWFRLSRRESDTLEGLDARFGRGLFLFFINRFDYWQVGMVVPKGGYRRLRAAGLEQLQQMLARAAPEVGDRVDELREWRQISVLSFESSRLKRWHKPGLLLIGDAAHVMSPVGGVGINYAIADAVVASNILGAKLRAGEQIQQRDLAGVQRRRELPTRIIQTFQALAQRVVMGRLAASAEGDLFAPPGFVRVVVGIPALLALPARLIGFGLWPPHVKGSRNSKRRK